MVFDPLRYDVEWVPFGEESHPMVRAEALRDIYDVGELEKPHNMPEARGEKLILTFLLMQITQEIELHGGPIQVSLSS